VPSDQSHLAGALWEADVAHLDGLSQMLYMDARLSLADNLLMYGDKMAMAVSLEARVPLLDLDLMRFVECLPPGLKIRGMTGKYILRRAVEKWIPSDVIARKKVPFRPPIDRWLRTELRSHLTEVLLADGSACRMYFEPRTVRGMIDDHNSGRQNYKRLLLSLLVFELWYDQFIRPSGRSFHDALFQASRLTGEAST
jgi:asparagine synthase (glutamine-hydrolysing)